MRGMKSQLKDTQGT